MNTKPKTTALAFDQHTDHFGDLVRHGFMGAAILRCFKRRKRHFSSNQGITVLLTSHFFCIVVYKCLSCNKLGTTLFLMLQPVAEISAQFSNKSFIRLVRSLCLLSPRNAQRLNACADVSFVAYNKAKLDCIL